MTHFARSSRQTILQNTISKRVYLITRIIRYSSSNNNKGNVYSEYMSDDEFRETSGKITELLIKYKNDLSSSSSSISCKYPVCNEDINIDAANLFGTEFPLSLNNDNNNKNIDDFLSEIEEKIIPNNTHWESPHFYGWMKCGVGLYHNTLSSMLMNGLFAAPFTYKASPIYNELEIITLKWYAKLLNLPSIYYDTDSLNATILSLASEAMTVSILAAKERILREDIDINSKLTMYCSEHTNFSFDKSCKILSIPLKNIRKIPVKMEEEYSLNGNILYKQIIDDIKNGYIPCFCCFNIGTTGFGAIDNISELSDIIIDINNKYATNIWIHIDGAYGLSYSCIDNMKYITNGLNKVNSININGHKNLLTQMNISLLYIKDSNYLIKALSLNKELESILNHTDKDKINYKDWQLGLGKNPRALSLYFTANIIGYDGYKKHIQRKLYLAQKFENLLKNDERIYLYKPRKFAIICFKLKNMDNNINQKLLDNINKSGKMFLVSFVSDGDIILRLSVGGLQIENQQYIDDAFNIIKQNIDLLYNQELLPI